MLEMRPNCETCNIDLPPNDAYAYICSFECTYCEPCSKHAHDFVCPNCKGALVERPTREGQALVNNPASTKRINAQ